MVATGLAAVHTNLRRLHSNILFLYNSEALARFARSRILVQFIVTGFAH